MRSFMWEGESMFEVAQTSAQYKRSWDCYGDIVLPVFWGKRSLHFHSPWSQVSWGGTGAF